MTYIDHALDAIIIDFIRQSLKAAKIDANSDDSLKTSVSILTQLLHGLSPADIMEYAKRFSPKTPGVSEILSSGDDIFRTIRSRLRPGSFILNKGRDASTLTTKLPLCAIQEEAVVCFMLAQRIILLSSRSATGNYPTLATAAKCLRRAIAIHEYLAQESSFETVSQLLSRNSEMFLWLSRCGAINVLTKGASYFIDFSPYLSLSTGFCAVRRCHVLALEPMLGLFGFGGLNDMNCEFEATFSPITTSLDMMMDSIVTLSSHHQQVVQELFGYAMNAISTRSRRTPDPRVLVYCPEEALLALWALNRSIQELREYTSKTLWGILNGKMNGNLRGVLIEAWKRFFHSQLEVIAISTRMLFSSVPVARLHQGIFIPLLLAHARAGAFIELKLGGKEVPEFISDLFNQPPLIDWIRGRKPLLNEVQMFCDSKVFAFGPHHNNTFGNIESISINDTNIKSTSFIFYAYTLFLLQSHSSVSFFNHLSCNNLILSIDHALLGHIEPTMNALLKIPNDLVDDLREITASDSTELENIDKQLQHLTSLECTQNKPPYHSALLSFFTQSKLLLTLRLALYELRRERLGRLAGLLFAVAQYLDLFYESSSDSIYDANSRFRAYLSSVSLPPLSSTGPLFLTAGLNLRQRSRVLLHMLIASLLERLLCREPMGGGTEELREHLEAPCSEPDGRRAFQLSRDGATRLMLEHYGQALRHCYHSLPLYSFAQDTISTHEVYDANAIAEVRMVRAFSLYNIRRLYERAGELQPSFWVAALGPGARPYTEGGAGPLVPLNEILRGEIDWLLQSFPHIRAGAMLLRAGLYLSESDYPRCEGLALSLSSMADTSPLLQSQASRLATIARRMMGVAGSEAEEQASAKAMLVQATNGRYERSVHQTLRWWGSWNDAPKLREAVQNSMTHYDSQVEKLLMQSPAECASASLFDARMDNDPSVYNQLGAIKTNSHDLIFIFNYLGIEK